MRPVWTGASVALGFAILGVAFGPPAGAARELRDVDARLDGLGREMSEARFQEVLDRAEPLRSALAAPDSPARRLQLARLETLAASAHLALAQTGAAERCFSRALHLVPDLVLDPVRTAPKVRRALDAVRRAEADAGAVEANAGAIEVSRLFGPNDTLPHQIGRQLVRAPAGEGPLSPTVTLRLLVDAQGQVAQARVYQPRIELVAFERAALDAAQRFRFEPARRDGKPIAAWLQWPVRFE